MSKATRIVTYALTIFLMLTWLYLGAYCIWQTDAQMIANDESHTLCPRHFRVFTMIFSIVTIFVCYRSLILQGDPFQPDDKESGRRNE